MNQKREGEKPPKAPRAINQGPHSDVAQTRRSLYQNALGKVSAALNDGYAIEAVTLLESMIADRLEARRAKIHSQKLEKRKSPLLIPLIDELCGNNAGESDTAKELYEEVRTWTEARNTAIHQMVKLPENSVKRWDEKYAEARITAESGLDLFRRLDTKIKELNRHRVTE